MPENRLQFGIVGAGYIAQAYAAVLPACESVAVAGVADLDALAAAALAARLDCPAFPSHTALAAARPLDVAIVCTPPASHCAIACDLLARGVHVLCEKPFSIGRDDAQAMVNAARAAGVLVAMASKYRHTQGARVAKQLLEEGALGIPERAELAFTARVDMTGRWHVDPRVSGGGVLMDNGPHGADLLRWLLGPLDRVRAREGERPQGLGVEETVRVETRSRGGADGCIDLSWSDASPRDDYLVLHGSEGIVRVGWRGASFRPKAGADWRAVAPGYDKLDAFRGQVENFAAAVRGREPLRADAADALASVHFVDAAYDALRLRDWRDVGPLG